MTRKNKSLLIWIAVALLFALWAQAQDDPYRTQIEAVQSEGIFENADVGVVFDSTDVRVEDTGLSHIVQHRLLKVLSWAGAKSLTALRFDYDPASNLLEPRLVVVHRADGSLEPVDPTIALDLPQPQRMIYWGARMKVLELPRLDVGDAVEIVTYKKGFQIAYLDQEPPPSDDERFIPPQRGHFYDVIVFQEDYPIREKVYSMSIARNKPAQYKVYNGEVFSSITFEDDRLRYTFWAVDKAAVKHEPRQPDATDFVPKVVLATVRDWPERSRWFFEVNNEILEPDEDVRRQAQEIVRGLKTDEDKIAAVLHWTAQNIRYSGITMGEGEGYTLHSGIMTLHDRCGVCKDIAGMSISLLRGLDYTVYPAMTMAGARVELIPADQFNHCVVAIKRPDGSYFMIDPTWAPYAMDVWSPAEAEQNYVIGSPEGENRRAIRTYAPEENKTLIDFQGVINEFGDLEGTITLEGTSYGDTRLRRGIAYTPAEQHASLFADWVSRIAENAAILEVKPTDIDDLSKLYRIQIKFRALNYALMAADHIWFAPVTANFQQAAPRTFDFVYEMKSEERLNPMLLWNTRQIILTESIQLPGKYTFVDAPEPEEVGGEIASCRSEVTYKSNTYKSRLEYLVTQRTVEQKDYQQVKKSYDAIKDFGKKVWQVKKGA
ncbi:MAG: DUF3857 and transglutaminase domain-containing protein [bacterium]